MHHFFQNYFALRIFLPRFRDRSPSRTLWLYFRTDQSFYPLQVNSPTPKLTHAWWTSSTGCVADLEPSTGSLWPPLAGGVRPSRLVRWQATSYNQGEQPGRRSFLLGSLSPPFLHFIAMQWFEQTEMAFIKKVSYILTPMCLPALTATIYLRSVIPRPGIVNMKCLFSPVLVL